MTCLALAHHNQEPNTRLESHREDDIYGIFFDSQNDIHTPESNLRHSVCMYVYIYMRIHCLGQNHSLVEHSRVS